MPVQALADSRHFDEGSEAGRRVHLLRGGSEDEVHASLLQQVTIRLKGGRIAGEVFIRTKLRRVDKDGSSHDIASVLRGVNEGEMSVVQSTHRGHEAKRYLRRGSSLFAGDTHGRNARKHLHALTSSIACIAVSTSRER